ncbi:16S rRNA (guanine(527)-N(7))-methyltransferase RsmG [Selenomonas sp. TAMA-11512]|nr:16S rRNA (guanine(527)-N(7))-methyltransferase RsmG [Selenomonas sp. TAMA-11512]
MTERFTDILRVCAEALHIDLTDRELARFTKYADLLVEWNAKINLTAITEDEDIAKKHILDSLTVLEAGIKEDAAVIDVGTGAGFPGLPLAIHREDVEVTLLDSLNKRVNFLQAVIDTLELPNVRAVHARAEEAARDGAHRERYDVAVARAVARAPVVFEYLLPFAKVGGKAVAMKGKSADEEREEAAKVVRTLGGAPIRAVPVRIPTLDDARTLLIAEKTSKTPKTYPRKAGTASRSPIV